MGRDKRKNLTTNEGVSPVSQQSQRVIVRKKRKFVFGKKHRQKSINPQNAQELLIEQQPFPDKLHGSKEDQLPNQTVDLLDDLQLDSQVNDEETGKKKRHTLLQKDMKGKPVFLEDTGEKLGIVYDMMYDDAHHCIGYKIKDQRSDTVLSFPLDQFDEDKNGLIFLPSWYTKSMKTIEKFEFKDRISPDLSTLLVDNMITYDEIYQLFVQHDDELAHYLQEAKALKEILEKRLRVLEKQRLALKDNLIDLTERRLIKDIDRKEFSEDVLQHRRKANILDVNIEKTKQLLQRLEKTSFGLLSLRTVPAEKTANHHATPTKAQKDDSYQYIDQNNYKYKYMSLRKQYQNLEQQYDELKIAVEKLMGNDRVLEK